MPEKIENIFALCPWVDKPFLYGDSKKSACVCIISVDKKKAMDWAE